jgi:predicted acetyltransferase
MIKEFELAEEIYIHDRNISSLFDREEFTAYVRQLKDNSKGIGLKPGFVPATTFWLIDR